MKYQVVPRHVAGKGSGVIDLHVMESDFNQTKKKIQPTATGPKAKIPFDYSTFNTRPPKDKMPDKPMLIIGFDTEYKSPDPLSLDQIKAGEGKVNVLSYQFHVITTNGLEWGGICVSEDETRMSIVSFIHFVYATGARMHGLQNLPTEVYLVGHFTRADIPTFSDFEQLVDHIDAIRNTFVTFEKVRGLYIDTKDGKQIEILTSLRDTSLLTSANNKSLKSIGELIGIEKVELSEEPAKRLSMIANMDRLMQEDWPLFKRYAMTDAVICANYFEKIQHIYFDLLGSWKVPTTLTTIGVDLAIQSFKDNNFDELDVLGKQLVPITKFNPKTGKTIARNAKVLQEKFSIYSQLITECYHGGRNEQFWFGPGFEADWNDFDLSSAYPTAMSLIEKPDWDGMYHTTNIKDFKPVSLGFAWIEFEFPKTVRYPTLPVRTNHGLIFPRTGRCYCSSPEIFLAKMLEAKIKIIEGVVVPTEARNFILQPLVRGALKRRKNAETALEKAFWKEMINSTYGKLAQGLQDRRIYDIHIQGSRQLDKSEITNCAYAAFTTSFVRAVLGQMMNLVPANRMVFSCTTDGFITNATSDEMKDIVDNSLFPAYYEEARYDMGAEGVLETKHAIKRPLGWTTRGQATLSPGDNKIEKPEFNYILAKAGIYTVPEIDNVVDKNQLICDLFFNRFTGQKIKVIGTTGLRDILENESDFVSKLFEKKLKMEYDWKRQPFAFGYSDKYKHICFNTVPWDTVQQFITVRALWKQYTNEVDFTIKSIDNFKSWQDYLSIKSCENSAISKYIHKENGVVRKLRKKLCMAFKQKRAGVTRKGKMTNVQFAEALTLLGIPCSKTDVENGLRGRFDDCLCPRTEESLRLVNNVKEYFKSLDVDQILVDHTKYKGIHLPSTKSTDQFTSLVD